MPATYSIGLVVLFYVLLVAEFFVPSGGLLGIGATVAAVTAVIIAMTHSLTWGLSVLLFMLLTTPIVLTFVLRLWPKTPIGRRMLNRQAETRAATIEGPTTLDGVPLEQLVGKIGIARSPMLPAGFVMVDGHKADAVSTGQPIEMGTAIIVVRVHMRKLQVRAARPEELTNPEDSPETIDSGVSTSQEPASKNASNNTLEQIDLDTL